VKRILIVKLVLTTLLYLVVNVAVSFGVVAVYAYLIRPGMPEQHYQDWALISAPYSSIFAGMPLMFALCWWVSRWRSVEKPTAAVWVIWLTYAALDLGILFGTGAMTPKMAMFSATSLITKLAAGMAGAHFAGSGE
jgi:hypothetical protein